MMGAITIFGESILYIKFCGYGLIGDKVSWVGCTFEEVTKNKMSEDPNVNSLQPN
jgi:hypothetical protein